jgi:inorganic pyrophosphatase
MYKLIAFLLFIPTITFSNPINDNPIMEGDNLYNFFIEIPAGTKQKWEIDKKTGLLEWEIKNSKKRIISFISYPGNYGFIPQTMAGDGDPMDVIDLEEARLRGDIPAVKIIGGMYFEDKGEEDIKLIAINPEGVFGKYETIESLMLNHPSVVEILKNWFMSYKMPGKMVFHRLLTKKEAIEFIETAHEKWRSIHIN